MSESPRYNVPVLKQRRKEMQPDALAQIDAAAERLGFTDRQPEAPPREAREAPGALGAGGAPAVADPPPAAPPAPRAAALAPSTDLAKPKRGAPVRVTRQNPRRVSIELDGEVFKQLQLLGVERGEKLQTMCERAVLEYLRAQTTASLGE